MVVEFFRCRARADHDDLRVLPVYATYDVFPSKYLALAGVITGLTLYNGAVIAEIVRAGVNALPRGQAEASLEALGLDAGAKSMRSILLPQAITSMLPVLVSQMVVVLKDTAIGYQITFVEMVRQGTNVGSSYGNYLPALIVIAILMICVNFGLGVVRHLARRPVATLEAWSPSRCTWLQ